MTYSLTGTILCYPDLSTLFLVHHLCAPLVFRLFSSLCQKTQTPSFTPILNSSFWGIEHRYTSIHVQHTTIYVCARTLAHMQVTTVRCAMPVRGETPGMSQATLSWLQSHGTSAQVARQGPRTHIGVCVDSVVVCMYVCTQLWT